MTVRSVMEHLVAIPLSEEKRDAILAAATSIFAAEGVNAPTTRIAQKAKVAKGSLFVYFSTKDALLNAVYRRIKSEIATAIVTHIPDNAAPAAQARAVWDANLDWMLTQPEKWQAMGQLAVSHRVSEDTILTAAEPLATVAPIFAMLPKEGAGVDGLRAAALMTAISQVALDAIIADPVRKDHHSSTLFTAWLRAIGSQ